MRRYWPILCLALAGCANPVFSTTPAEPVAPSLHARTAPPALYVAQIDDNDPVVELDPQTGKTLRHTQDTPQTFGFPWQTAFGVAPDGNVYFASDSHMVELSPELKGVAIAPFPKFSPFSIAFTDSSVIVGELGAGGLGVYPFGLKGGPQIESTVSGDTALLTTFGSTLYAFSFTHRTITAVSPPYSGGVKIATIPGLGGSRGIAVSSTSRLYAATSDYAPIVYQIEADGSVRRIATLAETAGPSFTIDSSNNVYAMAATIPAQNLPGSVEIFAPGATTPFAATEKNQICSGLAVRAFGSFYVLCGAPEQPRIDAYGITGTRIKKLWTRSLPKAIALALSP